MDRKFAGVSAVPILAIRDVTSIANMPTVFGIFFILLYFRYSNSNIEAKTVLLFYKHAYSKVVEVNVFGLCFGTFTFVGESKRS